jgi:hypothetical protein
MRGRRIMEKEVLEQVMWFIVVVIITVVASYIIK